MRIDKETFEEYLKRLQDTKDMWNKDIEWDKPKGNDDFLYHLIFLDPYTVDEWNILGDFKSIEIRYLNIEFEPTEIETQHIILAPWGKYYLIHYIDASMANRKFLDAYEVKPYEITKIDYKKIGE